MGEKGNLFADTGAFGPGTATAREAAGPVAETAKAGFGAAEAVKADGLAASAGGGAAGAPQLPVDDRGIAHPGAGLPPFGGVVTRRDEGRDGPASAGRPS